MFNVRWDHEGGGLGDKEKGKGSEENRSNWGRGKKVHRGLVDRGFTNCQGGSPATRKTSTVSPEEVPTRRRENHWAGKKKGSNLHGEQKIPLSKQKKRGSLATGPERKKRGEKFRTGLRTEREETKVRPAGVKDITTGWGGGGMKKGDWGGGSEL